ncbi:hypothetical protein F4604DRAFT_1674914 [Suillus subluteus]|nr:hypothetical protein F4604DRAFT_1674914 [Suillus subluteus]
MYGQRINTITVGKDRVADESARWKVYNTAETGKRTYSSTATIVIAIDSDIYKIFISGIVPRPIAFVYDMISGKITNYPPIISFACNHSAPGCLKDTIANLKNSQGFIHQRAIRREYALPGFDKWTISGLTKEKMCIRAPS